MATVTLWINRHDKAVYDLPRVCMKCGTPSTTIRNKQFSWYPPWVSVLLFAGLLPYVIVVRILTKQQRVEVPFCDQHKNHWILRTAITLGSLLVLLGGGFAFLLLVSPPPAGPNDDGVMGLFYSGCAVAIVGWFILIAVLNGTAIRPTNITDREITLTNVSPEFVRVLRDEEEAYERDSDPDVSERWREYRRRADRPNDTRIERNDDRRRPRRSTDISGGETGEPR